jgi:hypothetical protein
LKKVAGQNVIKLRTEQREAIDEEDMNVDQVKTNMVK